jgi:hypothetical protein
MEVGSVWGHGSYVAPDWTADWLHREALFILDRWSVARDGFDSVPPTRQAELQSRLQQLMRTNTYRDGTVTIDPVRAEAFEANLAHYLARLGNRVDAPATTVSSPQIEITSYATDSTAAAGTHFSVVLDVRPAPGIHVYAPGVTGYKPIALSIQSQPGLIVREVQYPRSEIYHFKPLNERVLVFQRPLRIVQDIAIDATPRGQVVLKDVASLAIKGILNYQACDDKICFTPQSVPLEWTVTLRQLDRERAKP